LTPGTIPLKVAGPPLAIANAIVWLAVHGGVVFN
jgi:hypothetical protein